MLTLKTLDVKDNGQLMVYLSIAAVVTANVFLLILALVFKDGIAIEASKIFQDEITYLVPTSGVVITVQHFVSAFFASRQLQQTVSRETQASNDTSTK